MKDILKRNEYLNREVWEDIHEITEDIQNHISNYPKDNQEILKDCYNSLFDQNIKIIIAKYSLYKNRLDIKTDFAETLNYMDASWGNRTSIEFTYGDDPTPYFSYDQYWKLITMLSLGILLEVSDEEFNKIVKVREKVPEKDYLLDILISYKIKGYEVVEHIMETSPYQTLEKVIKVSTTDKELALKMLQDYLSKQWYKDNKEMYWYGYHKEPKLFFGYWSFESGALVKILGLDDSILKDQKYYPYDMVHWKK